MLFCFGKSFRTHGLNSRSVSPCLVPHHGAFTSHRALKGALGQRWCPAGGVGVAVTTVSHFISEPVSSAMRRGKQRAHPVVLPRELNLYMKEFAYIHVRAGSTSRGTHTPVRLGHMIRAHTHALSTGLAGGDVLQIVILTSILPRTGTSTPTPLLFWNFPTSGLNSGLR